MEKQLRFAPLVRVSTEKQKQKGSSLQTQSEQIKTYVSMIDCGIIPDHCWKYAGQEHASPDYERKLLDQLLQDSGHNLFDAVIVCDTSRWSRDNRKNKEGLEVLRNNGIRFFVGTMEYDLHNPEHNFILGMSAEVGELQARQGAQKSIINRINRAKDNIPSSGRKPYGRTYNKKKGKWGVDKVKKQLIEKAAEMYIEGEQLEEIARAVGVSSRFLHHTMMHNSGTQWTVHFKSVEFNIDERVTLTVPRLLEDNVIAAVHERCKMNKTNNYGRGHSKNRYLLSGGFIWCSRCGKAMRVVTNHSGIRYYRHAQENKHECGIRKQFRAAELENGVLLELVTMFGDKEKVERAIRRSIPDIERRKKLEAEKKEYSDQLNKIRQEKSRIVKAIAMDTISEQEAAQEMTEYREREQTLNKWIFSIDSQLNYIPDVDHIKRSSKMAVAVLANALKNPELIFERDFEWKRRLIERVFMGIDREGHKLGVYLDILEDGSKVFEIRGNFESTVQALPLTDSYLEDTFNLDPDYCDVKEEIGKIRAKVKSKVLSGGQEPYLKRGG